MTLAARLAALAAPLLVAACTTAHGIPLPMSGPAGPKGPEFLAGGELRSSIGKSVAWDDWHIRGPRVNLTRSADGGWDGTGGPDLSGFHLEVKPGMLSGPGVSLSVEKMPDGFIEVGGLFFQDRYWLRISPARLTGHTHGGRCSFEFKRVSPALFSGDVACGTEISRVTIELLGTAARVDDPILPQFAVALVAVLP